MNFYAATFRKHPPQFYQRTLHQDTDWTNTQWPEPSDDQQDLEQDIRAYERLRLIAKDQGSLAQEYIFFREEMACKTKLRWKTGRYGAALLYSAYGLFQYGHSLTAPLVGLGANAFIGAVLLRMDPTPVTGIQAMGHSLANTFPFFRIMPRRDVWADIPQWLVAVAGLQSALGLILLFLFGLALRAALRMR